LLKEPVSDKGSPHTGEEAQSQQLSLF
jgi:hypothetical protein